MAILERDPHVFAAATGRRAHALRLAGVCVGLLSLAWLGALGVAVLGARTLPAGLPATKARSAAPAAAPAHVVPARLARAKPVPNAPARSRAAAAARPAQTVAHASATVPRTRVPVAPPAAVPPPPPPVRQGWARRGWTAPPGRAKQDQPHGQSASHSHNPH